MISPEEAQDLLGDKLLAAVAEGVRLTREDLAEYRALRPDWVANQGARGLANWIQDQLWAHITTLVIDVDHVEVFEKGATRELVVDSRVRIRVKRHHLDGAVSTYETQGALDFLAQPAGQLPGMEEAHLIGGYEWDRDVAEIGAAVLTLRDGKENVVWRIELPEQEPGGSIAPIVPPSDAPQAPTVTTRVTEEVIRDAQAEGT